MTTARRPLLWLTSLLLLTAALFVSVPAAEAGPEARAASLRHALATRRLRNVRFEEATLKDFVRWLRVATGKNIVIRHQALAKAGIDAEDVQITLTLDDVTAATLLKIALEPHGLAVVVKGNVVYVTTRVDALGRPVTRLYGISHITWTKVDFIAPEINLRPSDFMPVNEYEPERIVENDPLNTGDAVAELLQELVAPGEWDNAGWGIRATDRHLVVRAPRAVQARIHRALAIIASLK